MINSLSQRCPMEALESRRKVTWFAMRKRETVAVYHEVGSHFLKSNSHRFYTPERRGQELVAVALEVLAKLRGRVAPFVAHQACCEYWAQRPSSRRQGRRHRADSREKRACQSCYQIPASCSCLVACPDQSRLAAGDAGLGCNILQTIVSFNCL